MVDLALSLTGAKKPEPSERSTEVPLSQMGLDVWTDAHFDNRVLHNRSMAKTVWTDEDIDSFDFMSEPKKKILKRVNRIRDYLEENVPHGRAIEKPRMSDAVIAMNDLLLMTEDLAFSDTEDQSAIILANDYLAGAFDIVHHTFDTGTNTVNKTYVGVKPQGPGGNQPTMVPVSGLQSGGDKPDRGGNEYAGRNAVQS